MIELTGTWLLEGAIDGEVVRLEDSLSFWGGFDPRTGCVVDRSHPQFGVCLTGKVVAMPGSRGSSGTPGVLAESIRLATGPAALVVTKGDINLVAGAIAAEALYELTCPVLQIDRTQFDRLADTTVVTASPSKEKT